MSHGNVLSVEDSAEDVEHNGSIIWNYYKVDGAQSKQRGTKNSRWIFVVLLWLCAVHFKSLPMSLVELFLRKEAGLASVLILGRYTSTASFFIQQNVIVSSIAFSIACEQRTYASVCLQAQRSTERRQVMLHAPERCTGTQLSSMPFIPWVRLRHVTSGCWALVSAPQRPRACQPCFSHIHGKAPSTIFKWTSRNKNTQIFDQNWSLIKVLAKTCVSFIVFLPNCKM